MEKPVPGFLTGDQACQVQGRWTAELLRRCDAKRLRLGVHIGLRSDMEKSWGKKNTLPETNVAPENGAIPKGNHYSNHPFSGAMLVFGMVVGDTLW